MCTRVWCMLIVAGRRDDPTCRHNEEQVCLADGHISLEPVPSVEGEALIQTAGTHDAADARDVCTARREAIDAEDVAAQRYSPANCIRWGPSILKLCLPSRSCMCHVEAHHCERSVAATAPKLEKVPEDTVADGHMLVHYCAASLCTSLLIKRMI